MPSLDDLVIARSDGLVSSCSSSNGKLPTSAEEEFARIWAELGETKRSLREELVVASNFRESIAQDLDKVRAFCDSIKQASLNTGTSGSGAALHSTCVSACTNEEKILEVPAQHRASLDFYDEAQEEASGAPKPPPSPTQSADAARYFRLRPTARDATLLVNFYSHDKSQSKNERRRKLVEAIALMLIVLLTCTYQILMCLIVAFALRRDHPINDELVQDIRRWRLKDGHDFTFADPTSHTSLVAQVCGEDKSLSTATYQLHTLADVRDYMNPFVGNLFLVGPATLVVVIFLWTLVVLSDIVESSKFLNAVVALPSGPSKLIHTDSSYRIEQISSARRALASAICILMVCIDGALLFSGILWLRDTGSIEDMILNSVALSFFFNVDEIIFSLLAPSRTASRLESLMPLRLSPSWKVLHVEVGFRAVSAAVGLGLVTYGVTFISDLVDVMEGVERELCDGDLNFVVARTPLGEVMFSSVTAFGQGLPEGLALQNVVDQLRNADGSGTLLNEYSRRGWIWAGSSSFIQSKISVGIEARVASLWCVDTSDPSYFNPYTSTGNASVSQCSEAKPYCTGVIPLVRSYCPVTCGCDNPYSGLPQASPELGCPSKCQEAEVYHMSMDAVPCSDWSPQSLQNHSGWQYFLVHAPVLEKHGWTLLTSDPESTIEQVFQAHASEGCEMIRRYAPGLCSFGARSFCPAACNCPGHHKRGCPTSCANKSLGTLGRSHY